MIATELRERPMLQVAPYSVTVLAVEFWEKQ